MNIRVATKGDEEQVLTLIGEVLGGYGLKLEPQGADQDVTDLEQYYFDRKGWFQVVESEGEIIGSVGVYCIDDEVCELRKMYLNPEFQGRGIGKALMDNALVAAKELGYKEMSLQTNSLLIKALPLYEKYGFVPCKEEVCSRCDIAMKRKL